MNKIHVTLKNKKDTQLAVQILTHHYTNALDNLLILINHSSNTITLNFITHKHTDDLKNLHDNITQTLNTYLETQ